MLNVSFLVPQMRREFGGCAGNIAYNLQLLGRCRAADGDGGQGFRRLTPSGWRRTGVPRDHVKVIESRAHRPGLHHHGPGRQPDHRVPSGRHAAVAREQGDAMPPGVTVGIVAPDGRDGMIQHAEQFAAAKIPFIFDPGQGLPMFGKEDLERFVAQATWVAVNEYEWQLLQQKTGWTRQRRGQAGGCADRDAGRRKAPRSTPGMMRSPSPAPRPRRSWTLPAAATPTAPASSTACCMGWTGRPPGRSPRSWGRSRSRPGAPRITGLHAPSSSSGSTRAFGGRRAPVGSSPVQASGLKPQRSSQAGFHTWRTTICLRPSRSPKAIRTRWPTQISDAMRRCRARAGQARPRRVRDAGEDRRRHRGRRDHHHRVGRLRSADPQDHPRHRLQLLRDGLRRRKRRRHQHHRQAVARHRAGRGPQGREEAGRRRPGPDVRLRHQRDGRADARADRARAPAGQAAGRRAQEGQAAVAAPGCEEPGHAALRGRQAGRHRRRRALDPAQRRHLHQGAARRR